jgi:hypothetical protein
MKVYSLGFVSEEDLLIFKKIERIMNAMPDVDLGPDTDLVAKVGEKIPVSCHMIARGLSCNLGLEYKDGYFYDMGWNHSWLVTPVSEHIIDPYPWGALGGPLLIVNDRFNPSFRLYREEFLPYLNTDTFYSQVEIVSEAIKNTIQELKI